jgi:hypothetical protein
MNSLQTYIRFRFLRCPPFRVGCAAAVIYTIYMGGYRRAISDSLLDGETKGTPQETEIYVR